MLRLNLALVLLFISVASCTCFWNYKKKDALTLANSVLVNGTESSDLAANILVAESYAKAPKDNEDAAVVEILSNFVKLGELNKQLKSGGNALCRSQDFNIMQDMHHSMLNNSKKSPYKQPQSLRRINLLAINMLNLYAKVCFKKLVRWSLELFANIPESKKDSLIHIGLPILGFFSKKHTLSDAVNHAIAKRHVKNLSTTGAWANHKWNETFRRLFEYHYNQKAIRVPNPETGKLYITVDRVEKLYDQMITQVCKYFENRKLFVNVSESTIQLASSLNLSADIVDEKEPGTSDLFLLASSYEVCKELKNVDKQKVYEGLVKTITNAEDLYLVLAKHGKV